MATRKDSQTFAQFCAGVEAEYGEPAISVIRSMRQDDKLSWDAIAEMTGTSRNQLLRWARLHGFHDGRRIPPPEHPNEYASNTLQARARQFGYTDVREILAERTRTEAAELLGCSPGSFSRRVPGGLGYDKPLTPRQIAARKAAARRLNSMRSRPAHPTPG